MMSTQSNDVIFSKIYNNGRLFLIIFNKDVTLKISVDFTEHFTDQYAAMH